MSWLRESAAQLDLVESDELVSVYTINVSKCIHYKREYDRS